jgi:DNA-binding GntR family transcriptional regulator
MTRRARTAPTTDLADAAYVRLARAIATGEIAAGAPLNEREVSVRLGMSRTPLRAALHRLSLEGLVTAVPKKGTYAAPLDARDVADNMAVREALEIEMVHRAIEAGIELDDTALDNLLEAQQHAIEHLDSPAFLEQDERFHLYILAAAGNRRAVEAAQRAWLHVNRARSVVPMTVATMQQALRDHRAIAAAMVTRDATRVQQAIRDHRDDTLLQRLRQAEPDAPDPDDTRRRAAELQATLTDPPLAPSPTQ